MLPVKLMPATPLHFAALVPGASVFRVLICLLGCLAWWPAAGSAAGVRAYRGQLEIPTYPWRAVKHPYFRGTDKVNIYPYPMLDHLSRTKESRVWRTVVLENEYLRVTFLPELGGKIHEVLDRTAGQPMFYVNHVVKPGLIGQCGAWVSGGVEWNTGPQGHTVSAVQPVDVLILPPAPDGSRSVAIGETERIYQTRWTVVVTLRPGRSFLEESIRIYNATDTVRPYYFWNCTAMPNTPGFRFIYPMTLGSDHGATKFFQWPVDGGKDLTRGTNYQDASSIFAWHCDQDFFGSYDDGADRGVVAFANHHQLPGKKAWTWGQGGFGRMHQMDLTDADGPYNEVQTGPLLTQADVGRLDPHEAVGWSEWWYPVRGIGGFTFANRDVAVNAGVTNGQLRLRLIGTGSWSPVEMRVFNSVATVARANCAISPRAATDLKVPLGNAAEPYEVELVWGRQTLARFRVPLDLPVRHPPKRKLPPQTASELAQAGWEHYLFARFAEAEGQFRKALAQDTKSVAALTGLAYLKLDNDPAVAISNATQALAIDPEAGLARFALAAAEYRAGDEQAALADAWKAALDPVTSVPARALAARLLVRQGNYLAAADALAEPGPWQSDPVCQDLRAFVCWKLGQKKLAADLASSTLAVEPLDALARCALWLAQAEKNGMRLTDLITQDSAAAQSSQRGLDLAMELAELGQDRLALRVLQEFVLRPGPGRRLDPVACYWAALLAQRAGLAQLPQQYRRLAQEQPTDLAAPHHWQSEQALRAALEANPNDGRAALLLGHLLFSLGRHDEGRAHWRQAAKSGTAPTIARRALGMASLTLDNDLPAARTQLQQAHEMDPADAIIARDLARVLFNLADKAEDRAQKTGLWEEMVNVLKPAFDEGRTRSDYVTLLARAQNRLGRYAETGRLLDTVRVTIWEGGREAHDLFEEAHLALGQEHLAAGRAREALAEFNRALEYPENLATGKLENTKEAHIHYLRGNALMAMGDKTGAIAAWKQAAAERGGGNAKITEARQKAREALQKAGAGE